jgi:2OG-Fe(II) oxygenase superfamily
MIEPIVIDNFLPELYHKSIYQLLTTHEIPWSFFNYSVSNYSLDYYQIKENQYKEHIQFRHMFTNTEGKQSEYFKYIVPLLLEFEKRTNLKIRNTVRIKSNLLMSQEGTKLQFPHYDDEYNAPDGAIRKTLLYYVNDSDGDTVMYNERYDGKYIDQLSVEKTVSPKKNRAIIFDSNQMHSGCCPEKSVYRIVVNCILECLEI